MSSLTSKSHNRLQVLSQHINPKQNQHISASVPQSLSFQSTSAATASASTSTGAPYPHKRKAVIVTGVRTPFVKAFGELLEVDAIGLGCAAVSGLLQKTKLDPENIDEIIWGNVVMNIKAPNVAREIVIDLNLPRKIPGVTVSRACLSGMQAIIQAVQMIEHGDAHCVIAGGSDSMSNGEISLPRNLTHALGKYKYGKKTGLAGVVQFFKDAGSPTTWVPQPPAIAERSTGKTMGYHADLMAELNNVSREAQDALAALSHQNAGKAVKEGKFAEEIVPITLASGKKVSKDNLIRENSDANKMSKLKPVFRKQGTVTAASSSPLTDGASCVLVMSEERARELGFPVDVTLVSSANSAVDPFPQLLLAPAFAIPKALDEAGLKIDDVDLFEIHEAFAAQVLSTTACLASDSFAQKRLGKSKAVGVIPPNKMNVNGGSIAIGHPFSATGGRLVTTAVNELRRSKKKYALLSICAAGGMGGALILKRE